MKTSPRAAAVLAVGLLAPTVAEAQAPGRAQTAKAPAGATAPPAANAPADSRVIPANASVPAPLPLDQIQPAQIALPQDPIEPYLLTRDHGPFMVLAHTFRGPEADRYALALALELRREHGLQALVCRFRDLPMRSRVFGVPPTAPPQVRKPEVAAPENVRNTEEAGVLVGHAATVDDAEKILHRVKKIHPKCLDGMPTIFAWRKGNGLKRAIITANPFVPAELLYSKKEDPILKQMNSGPRSVYNCPARYTLQIAEFMGRTTFDVKNDKRFQGTGVFKSSPLATAAVEADQLASALAKDPEIQRTGFQPYVYHDRVSSKVTIGAFQSPNDPAAARLRQRMLELAPKLNERKVTDTMIVPAALVDVKQLATR